VLIALHDVTLDATTDVEKRFPARRRDDGHWYVADFDWNEIATLRVHERVPGRFPPQIALFDVPRFADVIELVTGLNSSTGCNVGLYPEIKGSAFHHAAGLDPERAVLDALAQHADIPVRIQSFEPDSLTKLRAYGSRHHLVQLIGDDQPADITEITRYAQSIGPAKTRLFADPTLVQRAHAAGLGVVTWTFRSDQVAEGFPSFEAELDWATKLGVDQLFTDQPDRAVLHYGAMRTCK
jgi:glycerophosphoryl diester phosphodiesterase